jgi:hypothetical protein
VTVARDAHLLTPFPGPREVGADYFCISISTVVGGELICDLTTASGAAERRLDDAIHTRRCWNVLVSPDRAYQIISSMPTDVFQHM